MKSSKDINDVISFALRFRLFQFCHAFVIFGSKFSFRYVFFVSFFRSFVVFLLRFVIFIPKVVKSENKDI